MNLDSYRKKRVFAQTPEPPPGEHRERETDPVFVIHRHEARRLHYDLRLEMAGVLKSWAVPKGFAYDPQEKRLAIRTEDHPLEYEHFDGVIPKGQYGAGTMTIWDRGRFRLLNGKDGPAAIQGGKLEIRLFGGKLRGDWHLFETKEENQWLMFKAKDRYARGSDDADFAIDLTNAPRIPFPRRRYKQMMVSEPQPAFFDSDWLYEVKFSGRRVLVDRLAERIRIADGGRKDLAAELPEIVRQLSHLRAENFVADGILVCLDEQLRPSQQKLQAALANGDTDAIQLYMFDLLFYDDWDLRGFPLQERKAALASIIPSSSKVMYVGHERSRGEELLSIVNSAGLPGIVAKRADSRYSTAGGDAWIEISAGTETSAIDNDLATALEAGQQDTTTRAGKVRFTNRNRVLWAQDGYTKGDLIDYYDQVADQLVPYLKDRPLSLNRFPNGIDSDSFYQKDMPDHLPDWVETVEVPSSSGKQGRVRFIICNDRATLLYLANLASIDLHPWLSRRDALANPDWAIFDLDPGAGVPFRHVVTIARTLGKLLRGIGLRPYLKTSGASGIHISIPLLEGYTYEQSRTFCEGVAQMVVDEHPKIATIDRVKEQRGATVYIDYLQNRRGQTVVAPYVVRPVRGATVSAPLDWDELSGDLHPGMFDIHNMPRRIKRLGDLFAPTLTDRQDLMPAIEAIIDQLG